MQHADQLHVIDVMAPAADEAGIFLAVHPSVPHRGGAFRDGCHADTSSLAELAALSELAELAGNAAGCSAAHLIARTMFT